MSVKCNLLNAEYVTVYVASFKSDDCMFASVCVCVCIRDDDKAAASANKQNVTD